MSRRRKWTVAVWVAGDNNLESFGETDLGEMKSVGSTDDVAVVAQFDRMGDDQTRRYVLQAGTPLEQDVVAELGETNTGDPAVATDFFTWAFGEWPSEKRLAVIWNHGSGIDETDIYARVATRGLRIERGPDADEDAIPRARVREVASSGHRRAVFATTLEKAVNSRAIAYDDTARDFLDNEELKRVLTQVTQNVGGRIDVLGFDACLMNLVEVSYQLRGTVDNVVGSEEVEPGDGWPYDGVLKELVASPDLPPRDAAKQFVQKYMESYRGDETVTQSAVDVSQVEAVAEATSEFADTCIPLVDSAEQFGHFSKAVKNAQRFRMKDFADLGDLCARVGSSEAPKSARDAAAKVHEALFGTAPFVIASGQKGAGVASATGAAVYFPIVGDVQVAYDQLDFGHDTAWGSLIKEYSDA
jgi:cysteine peptidase C11 family protein